MLCQIFDFRTQIFVGSPEMGQKTEPFTIRNGRFRLPELPVFGAFSHDIQFAGYIYLNRLILRVLLSRKICQIVI